MATLTLSYPTPGLPLKAGVYDATGKIWNGSSFVTVLSLANPTAWRAVLATVTELTLNDATPTALYQVTTSATGYSEIIFYDATVLATPSTAIASISNPDTVRDANVVSVSGVAVTMNDNLAAVKTVTDKLATMIEEIP